ncbi:MAG: rhodanese-like domain-containing protein [Deltaproteobacteria bacterium]|nr:rhodanese-like domain-containing protein [Deltaproteobacteria bacterium]
MKLNTPEKAREYFENKVAFTTGPGELKHVMDTGESPAIIDVRSADEFALGHIPGAINLPGSEWPSFKGLSKEKLNVVYCYNIVCHLAARASYFFADKGYSVMELDGGFDTWKDFEYPVEKGKLEEAKLGRAA